MRKRIVGQKSNQRNVLKIPRPVSLREFYQRKDKIVIIRAVGGLGDILIHRMMFEDFKRIDPDIKIVFATLPCYFDAVKDHPFVDEVVNSDKIDLADYNISYNTTSACNRYEIAMSPYSGLNRSDIWANHCGVELKHHNMHLRVSPESMEYGKNTVDYYRQTHKGPIVLLCPISAMIAKNLLDWQIEGVIKELRNMNCFVLASHVGPVSKLIEMDVPIIRTTILQLFGLTSACDYIISVDTAQIHVAGGLKKPTVGIFTFADGLVYCQNYPTVTVVQKHRALDPQWICGPCYNWPNCTKTNAIPKPCLTEITVGMIIGAVKKMMKKYPQSTIL